MCTCRRKLLLLFVGIAASISASNADNIAELLKDAGFITADSQTAGKYTSQQVDKTFSGYILHTLMQAVLEDGNIGAHPEARAEVRKNTVDNVMLQVGDSYEELCRQQGLAPPRNKTKPPPSVESADAAHLNAYMVAALRFAAGKITSASDLSELQARVGRRMYEALLAHADFTPSGNPADFKDMKANFSKLLATLQRLKFISRYGVEWGAKASKKWAKHEPVRLRWWMDGVVLRPAAQQLQQEVGMQLEVLQGALQAHFSSYLVDVTPDVRDGPAAAARLGETWVLEQ